MKNKLTKNSKKFSFTLKDGQVVNKFGKNIDVYQDGVYFKEDDYFVPRADILEIKEWQN